MICYKDKTFCDFEGCKKFNICDRAYTKEEKVNAELWMSNPPVCFFVNKPKCFEVKK